jgi:hypothetical protein
MVACGSWVSVFDVVIVNDFVVSIAFHVLDNSARYVDNN